MEWANALVKIHITRVNSQQQQQHIAKIFTGKFELFRTFGFLRFFSSNLPQRLDSASPPSVFVKMAHFWLIMQENKKTCEYKSTDMLEFFVCIFTNANHQIFPTSSQLLMLPYTS